VNGLVDLLRQWKQLRRAVRHAKRARRLIFERLGYDRYSHPSELDRRLVAYLPSRGVFVEAGAFDGYEGSTTYWLERFGGWRGVLIEPVPELAAAARRERPESWVFECALVPPERSGNTLTMFVGGTMSLLQGARESRSAELQHAQEGARIGRTTTTTARVIARTLSEVLDEAGVTSIDLLSLDIEGYEASALRGLDMERHRPTFILVEMLDEAGQRPQIETVLGDRYVHRTKLSGRDHLYEVDYAAS